MGKPLGLDRRRFCGVAAATVAATGYSTLLLSDRSKAMNAAAEATGSGNTAIRPFEVKIPEAELTKLRARVSASTPIRNSSPRSMGWTFISFTFGRSTRTRCPSS